MKYILKKEYPGSPKLGYIDDLNKSGHNNQGEYVQSMYDKNPEFWEKVVEKDYEILSFVNQNKSVCKINDTNYLESFVLANLHIFKIHSIKRLSDGEIFTIGDKTNFGLISKIVINNNSLSFYFEQKSCGYNLQTLIKWKPLFTTEDGVDIYDKDITIYRVDTEYYQLMSQLKSGRVKDFNDILMFSTKEKAEECILLNKPCLSYGDVQEYLKVKDCNKVLDLAQSKIQQSV